jgi:molecular chaperone DnaK
LNSAQHRAAEAMYRQAGTPPGGEPAGAGSQQTAGGASGAAGGDGVIDAEVVEEEKK